MRRAADAARGEPVYCPGGVRHEGGASSAQALVWNVGTCRFARTADQWRRVGLRSDAPREDSKRRKPRGAEYRCEAQGRTAPW